MAIKWPSLYNIFELSREKRWQACRKTNFKIVSPRLTCIFAELHTRHRLATTNATFEARSGDVWSIKNGGGFAIQKGETELIYFDDVPLRTADLLWSADFHSHVKLAEGDYQTSGMLTNQMIQRSGVIEKSWRQRIGHANDTERHDALSTPKKLI